MPADKKAPRKRKSDSESPPIPSADITSVESWVLNNLGTPRDFLKAIVVPITPNHYRVNVYVKKGWSAAISDSFWVSRSGDDYASDPAIRRKYTEE
jgi:hypothetical protein